jgi:hypothetical protein
VKVGSWCVQKVVKMELVENDDRNGAGPRAPFTEGPPSSPPPGSVRICLEVHEREKSQDLGRSGSKVSACKVGGPCRLLSPYYKGSKDQATTANLEPMHLLLSCSMVPPETVKTLPHYSHHRRF